MADRVTSSTKRKVPVSHKRVIVVLCSLVAVLTLSAGFLLALEDKLPLSNVGPRLLSTPADDLGTEVELREGAWDYIIVYESGAVAVSAADLAEGRSKGGSGSDVVTRTGANFHFVVDSANGADGELIKGSAWLQQKAGAPFGWPDSRNYSNSYLNAVGVCLIGEVTKASGAQVQELTALVKNLQKKLKIPANQVRFQWELPQSRSKPTPAQQSFADSFRQLL